MAAVGESPMIKGVMNITVNQVPKTKEWLPEIQSKYNVLVKIWDSGRMMIKGKSKDICKEAANAIMTRVMLDDFQNALEITNLVEVHPHLEQFSVDKQQLARLDEPPNVDLLKQYENILRCVLKIDRKGQISIFGEKKQCRGMRQLVMQLALHDEAKTPVQEEPVVTAETAAQNGGKPAETTVNVFADIDDVMKGDLAKKVEEEIGSITSKNSGSPNTVKSNSDDSPEGTIKLSKGGSASATSQPVNATRSFVSSQEKSRYKENFSSLPCKDRLVIEESEAGRVIGRNGSNRVRLESQFKCRVSVNKDRSSGITVVQIEGYTNDAVKAAKKDITEMLLKPGPWQNFRPRNQTQQAGPPGFMTTSGQSEGGGNSFKWPSQSNRDKGMGGNGEKGGSPPSG